MTPIPSTEAAMREAFEAHGKDRGWFLTHNPECLEAYLSVKTTSHWITWQAAQAHAELLRKDEAAL